MRNVARTDRAQRTRLRDLRSRYKTLGRARAIKKHFAHLWGDHHESIARRFFTGWYHWATHSRIPAVIEVARTIKRHFENIITYLTLRITNAGAEGLNSKIQMIKYRARGYRNDGSFERAILFHCGGLSLKRQVT
ncbi:MAG: hypothetical protein EPN48_18360 [Microbacteriaceae bacterium]|nr:MAG: hypothetical protein EPN48_18360 [Microbacteriaceae bacterium]